MIRFGLCCKFHHEKIKYREVRYIHLKKLSDDEKLCKLDEVILDNLQALEESINFCSANGIFAFRIGSALLPIYTHPDADYQIESLPSHTEIFSRFHKLKALAKHKNMRLSFHPDQFVILNSPREDVVENAIKDLEYHNYLSELLGADVINIHAGGVYGDKAVALKRLEKNVNRLSKSVRSRITFENDDKSYTPQDLLPICKRLHIPLVYDVHHHRCNKDQMGEAEVTRAALKTWNREPLFHLSSPKEGWDGPKINRHHDFIDPLDFPKIWKEIGDITVDIEAKAKEVAVIKLMGDLSN
ncbi:MAG: UV DNA damage endonuclease [Chlamydiae bacterium]|nr:UV DNA damage endonuclease [Chlamydiota bacterium]